MIFRPITLHELQHVARNMRESDRREIGATMFGDDMESFSAQLMNDRDFAWTAGTEDLGPIAAFGAVPLWPGSWLVWMFATPDFPKIAMPLTRLVKRKLLPAMLSPDFQRVQCHSIEGHDFAQRWLEFLGFNREASLQCYGKGGETFHLYSITRPPS